MHLLIVLAVVVGIAGVFASFEMSRRTIVGRRMERSIGALRTGAQRSDLRGLALVDPPRRPLVRPDKREAQPAGYAARSTRRAS